MGTTETLHKARVAQKALGEVMDAENKRLFQMQQSFNPPRAPMWVQTVAAGAATFEDVLTYDERLALAQRWEYMVGTDIEYCMLGEDEHRGWTPIMIEVWELLVTGLITPFLYWDESGVMSVTFVQYTS